jgi:hypothetical protein
VGGSGVFVGGCGVLVGPSGVNVRVGPAVGPGEVNVAVAAIGRVRVNVGVIDPVGLGVCVGGWHLR